MRYDLRSEKLNETFYIQCSLVDKPASLEQLADGVCDGSIKWQPDFEDEMAKLLISILERQDIDMYEALETDFTTCKPIRHNINWPRTEDTK